MGGEVASPAASVPGPRAAGGGAVGCGSRFDFLSHILDVFSLNGFGCCRDSNGGGGNDDCNEARIVGGGICA